MGVAGGLGVAGSPRAVGPRGSVDGLLATPDRASVGYELPVVAPATVTLALRDPACPGAKETSKQHVAPGARSAPVQPSCSITNSPGAAPPRVSPVIDISSEPLVSMTVWVGLEVSSGVEAKLSAAGASVSVSA